MVYSVILHFIYISGRYLSIYSGKPIWNVILQYDFLHCNFTYVIFYEED